jgi:hypothetical protein
MLAAVRIAFRSDTPAWVHLWVQNGSNKGPIRIASDCFPLFWAFVYFAKLLKVRLVAFSQRGGQRVDPAQLHHRRQSLSLKIWVQ